MAALVAAALVEPRPEALAAFLREQESELDSTQVLPRSPGAVRACCAGMSPLGVSVCHRATASHGSAKPF